MLKITDTTLAKLGGWQLLPTHGKSCELRVSLYYEEIIKETYKVNR